MKISDKIQIMIELIQLKQLECISRVKTLTAAGEQLNISQTALTRSMQRLEDDLGTQLFDRTKNSLTLNECGKITVEYAKKILNLSEQLVTEVQNLEKSRKIFSVGSCAPAPLWVIEEKFPDLIAGRKIEDELAEPNSLISGLCSKKYDCIILPFSVENSAGKISLNATNSEKFISKKICEENLCFFVPKNHKFAKKKVFKIF